MTNEEAMNLTIEATVAVLGVVSINVQEQIRSAATAKIKARDTNSVKDRYGRISSTYNLPSSNDSSTDKQE